MYNRFIGFYKIMLKNHINRICDYLIMLFYISNRLSYSYFIINKVIYRLSYFVKYF